MRMLFQVLPYDESNIIVDRIFVGDEDIYDAEDLCRLAGRLMDEHISHDVIVWGVVCPIDASSHVMFTSEGPRIGRIVRQRLGGDLADDESHFCVYHGIGESWVIVYGGCIDGGDETMEAQSDAAMQRLDHLVPAARRALEVDDAGLLPTNALGRFDVVEEDDDADDPFSDDPEVKA